MTDSRDVTAPLSPVRALRSDAARNHLVVLAAAREAYAQGGLGISFDEIARRAGVGVGTVYRRFPDRDALLRALFEDRFESVNDLARHALEADDAWSGLEAFVAESIRMFAEDRGLREIAFDATGRYAGVTRQRERLAPLLAAVTDRAHDEGVLRADCGAGDLASIIAMLSSLAPVGGDAGDDSVLRRCTRFVLDGMRAGTD